MKMNNYSNTILIILVTIFMAGCSKEISPIQVNGDLKIGLYTVTPPRKYWYFPREYHGKFSTPDDIYLLTFWDNKEVLKKKEPDKSSGFFNIAISKNIFTHIDEYYKAVSESGVQYSKLPEKIDSILAMKGWTCKQVLTSMYGIECVNLDDNLVIIAEFGNDKDLVIENAKLLKNMVESFKKE